VASTGPPPLHWPRRGDAPELVNAFAVAADIHSWCQVLPNKDRISRPSRGRFFACAPSQVVAAIKQHGFRHSEYFRRIDIELRNPSSQSPYGEQIAAFYPSNSIVLYSFPDAFEVARARRLIAVAFEEFQKVDVQSGASVTRRGSHSFRIYLGANNQLLVTRRVRTLTLTKYRGGAKFSNAFKPKKIDTSEELIRELAA
jgi:hypothetical protein